MDKGLARQVGVAFGIWAPIYPGGLAFAAYQARPSVRTDPVLRRVGWPVAFPYVAAGRAAAVPA